MLDLANILGFDWDQGNVRKSEDKHAVSQPEAEQIFFNQPLIVAADERHSALETRFHALGRTDDGRLLQIAFTLRNADTLIRVISARDMNRKERTFYAQAT